MLHPLFAFLIIVRKSLLRDDATMTHTKAASSSAASGSGVLPAPMPRRGPPKAIRLLLPVWGRSFIAQFMSVGLPTLLAPGNLPALAKALPCRLVFLTSTRDADILREHSAYRHLAEICEVGFESIDDLIAGNNNTATITLAYARAVKATGAEIIDTCFFFLTSDYLIADGSLAHVLTRIQAGISGVLAGNFQIIEQPDIQTLFKPYQNGHAVVLPARTLMRWALHYLHPITAANIVNFPLSHNRHCNRLLWRVDDNTLIGRFYLMHMVCIRPEVTDFMVGSSCDYSFIPEMCPSDNVEVLTDSDRYLVIEMQPVEHERSFLRPGALRQKDFAASLSEWTTARHRKNARSVVVFHSEDIPQSLPQAVAESTAFVAGVERLISAAPQPHRDHPYWIGALAAHNRAINRRTSAFQTRAAGPNAPGSLRGRARRLLQTLLGAPLTVRPWHPYWPDYRVVLKCLRGLLKQSPRLLIVSRQPSAHWSVNAARSTTSLETWLLLSLTKEQYAALAGSLDGCVLVLDEDELELAASLIEIIRPLLTENGLIVATVFNRSRVWMREAFNNLVTVTSSKFLSSGTIVSEVEFVPSGLVRSTVLQAMKWLANGSRRRPAVYLPLAGILGGILFLVGLAANIAAIRPLSSPGARRCSSATIVLSRHKAQAVGGLARTR